jgi:inosine/xanthosine triphosphate pyrophosphatase family protein
MNILFITGNKHKLREAKEILGDSVEGLKLDLLEIQSLDPKEIIEEKLREARKQIGKHDAIIMVEDVSFWIGDTGLPGPFIKFSDQKEASGSQKHLRPIRLEQNATSGSSYLARRRHTFSPAQCQARL